MVKPWIDLTAENVDSLPGSTGIYELGDETGTVFDICFAGGHSLFGLRSELQSQLAADRAGWKFRYEVTSQYMSRFHELVNIANAVGDLPEGLQQRGVIATGFIRPN